MITTVFLVIWRQNSLKLATLMLELILTSKQKDSKRLSRREKPSTFKRFRESDAGMSRVSPRG